MLPLHDDNPTRRRAWVTIALIVLNIGIYALWQPKAADTPAQQAQSVEFTYEHAAIPCEVTHGHPLQQDQLTAGCGAEGSSPAFFPGKSVWLAVLVSMFLHGGLLHVGGNMLFLWVFGNNAEDRLGHLRYLAFYLVAGVVATATYVALQPGSTVPLLGASGAVAGVMGAYLIWYPNVRVTTAFFFIFILFRRIKAKWVLGFWFLSQFFVNPNEGVAWTAHVGGFVFGMLVALLVRALSRTRPVGRYAT